MSMKNKLAMLGIMASMFDNVNAGNSNKLKPKDIDVTPKKEPIAKGCKEFEFWHDGKQFKCVASNQKTANKKFEKWKTLTP